MDTAARAMEKADQATEKRDAAFAQAWRAAAKKPIADGIRL